MTNKKRQFPLCQDDQFVERLILYANQHQQIQEELRNNYQNPLITLLKEEFGLNQKWIQAKLLEALNHYQENNSIRISKQLKIPSNFNKVIGPLLLVQSQKLRHIASNSYEGAAFLRDQELALLKNQDILNMLQEFRETAQISLKNCQTTQDYYTTANLILNHLKTPTDPNLSKHQNTLQQLCIQWHLNLHATILELSTPPDQEIAHSYINQKKLNWENEVFGGIKMPQNL